MNLSFVLVIFSLIGLAFSQLATIQQKTFQKALRRDNSTAQRFQDAASPCLSLCPFSFCLGPNSAVLSRRFFPATAPVCHKVEGFLHIFTVDRILSTREASVQLSGTTKFIPISRLMVGNFGRGTFYRNFFTKTKSGLVNSPKSAITFTGIAPRRAINKLDGSCVRLPVGKWIDRNGIKRSRDKGCISFQALVAQLEIILEWNSNDDFDISVIEPDGTMVATDQSSGQGVLLYDQFATCFGNRQSRRERIVYRPNVNLKKGRYTVRISHFGNCETGATRFKSLVSLNGRLIATRYGFSNQGFSFIGDLVKTYTFFIR